MQIVGYESLHQHTDFSILDGIMTARQGAEQIVKNNQKFFCITDHGMCAAFPQQIKACDEFNLNPLYGCEFYINPMQPNEKKETDQYTKDMNPDERDFFRKSFHLIGIAYNEQGYKNLIRLCSWGWLNGFYRKPRINYEQLAQHKEGIVFSSACANSEICYQLYKNGEDAAFDMVQKYRQMLGDNFYLEMMLLDFKKQKPYDAFLIKAYEKLGVPLIVTNDVHYGPKDESYLQRLFLMVQTGKTISQIEQLQKENDDLFELQDQNLWCKSEEELNEKWKSDYQDAIPLEIFEEAKRNTVRIAEMCKGVKIDRSPKLPQIENANEKLLDAIKEGLNKRNYPKNKQTEARLKEEYELIVRKEFASYFLIQKMMVDEARRACPLLLGWGDGSEAVGPGRGSGAGSLILYLLGVTDVDPIKHDLLFSRFLSPARGGKQMKLKFSGKPL